MIHTFKKIAVFTLVFLIAFLSFGTGDIFATTTGSFRLVNANFDQSFVGSSIIAGEGWRLNITNAAPNSLVIINSTQINPDGTVGPGTGVINLGFTDANGNGQFANTTSQVDIGRWTETLTVGGITLGNQYGFVVYPAPDTSTSPVPNTTINHNSCVQLVNTKNNASIIGSTMFSGESWKMIITSATPNASVLVTSYQTEPGGSSGLGTGSINLGFTDANGNAQFTNTTTGVDVGRWVETVSVGGIQLCDQFFFNVAYPVVPHLPPVIIIPVPPATTTPPVVPVVNHSPIISLIGSNPFNIVTGGTFIDPGATATDREDGNITNKIVVTGTVNTSVAGTYTRTYTVTDLGGLTVSTTRQVVVTQAIPSVNTSGKITVCLVLADSNNKIATSSAVFPSGMFGIQLGTTQSVASTSVFSKVWNTQTFTPNRTLLTGMPDADCVEVSNLDATASYYYSPLSVIGSAWKSALYNDQLVGFVASTSDFFPYNTDITNNTYPTANSNSVINLALTNGQRTFVIYNTYTATTTPATTTPPVNPPAGPNPVRACTIVSDTSTFTGGVQSVATYNQNPLWTASIPGATWIWSTFKVLSPLATSTATFTKTFIATSTPSQATLSIAADNSYVVRINGVVVGQSADEFNFTSTTQDVYSVGSVITAGVNTITFEVKNHAFANGTPETNPAGLLYKLELTGDGCGTVVINHPPVISLVGANPAQVTVGDSFIDPGATATDREDGNITNKIVVTGTVNTSVAGTYTRTYTVTDLGGLTASTTRQVVVSNPNNGGATTGKIMFCLVLADSNNQIATSSSNLPFGTFVLNLGTTTNITAGSIFSKTWTTMSFTPTERIILPNGKDAQCEQLQNLPFGTYYYSTLGVSGSQWNTPKYNDQNTQPINNVFDFFPYSAELFTATTTDDASRNTNSDGQIVLDASMREKTLVMYNTYNPAPQCLIPSLTSPLTAQVTVNNAFSYTLTGTTTVATTSPLVFSVATSTLPSGVSYATSTNTISGTPTQVGTYNITLRAENTCGVDIKTLVLSVVAGSTGGGGGSTPTPDLVVTKIAHKSTANVGDTVTYTVTVANNGTLAATGVTATDILPSSLTFVSATSTLGTYATSTGIWTIGNLPIASSTILTLVTTINSGTEGQKITNTATASSTQADANTANNSTSVDVNVNVPPSTGCSSNCGGGGGGGGGGGNGPIIPNRLTIYNEQVVETAPGVAFVSWNTTLSATRRVVHGNESNLSLGLAPNYGYTKSTDLVSTPLQTQHGMAISIVSGQKYYFRPVSTDRTDTAIGKELVITGGANGGGSSTGGIGGTAENSCYYLFDYLRKDFNNNPVEVKKLQIFLKDLEGFSDLQVTGVYDNATIAATNAFQIRYAGDVLTPWGYEGSEGTSYVYILTKKKVNEIYCKFAFPVTQQQQAEINATRALFESLRNAGIEIGGTPTQPTIPVDLDNSVIGSATTTGSGTLANASTTQNFAQRMTANVLSASQKLGALVVAFFAWPFQSSVLQSMENGFKTLGNNIISWLILALILAIVVVAYLWHLEYRNNKKVEEIEKIEEINKEIDLK